MTHYPIIRGNSFETHSGWSWIISVVEHQDEDAMEVKSQRADFATKAEAESDMATHIERLQQPRRSL